MQPTFGIAREKSNQLLLNDYESLRGLDFHFHSQIEIILVHSGEVEILLGDRKRTLAKDEAAIALSYTPHTFRTVSASSESILFIPVDRCEDFISATAGKRATNPFITDSQTVKAIKESFIALREAEGNKILENGYIHVILGKIFAALSFDGEAEPTDMTLSSNILFYVNQNFKRAIGLSDISEALGYNAQYVAKHFKAAFGISINKYLNTVRLKNALMLLIDKNESITDCAFESGFNSIRTFYRAFESEFKCSPREYLKREKQRLAEKNQ